MIYLDYTANTPVEPQVLEVFCEAESRFIGNANARHGAGREAAGAMARAAEACAELLGVQPEEVIFNSGAMELIRPLYRVHEEDIIAWKNAHELSFIQCACRFTENCTLCDNGGGGSKRQEVKQLLKRLNRDGGKVEKNVFNAIHMLQFDTFPGWKSNGVEHSFLENYGDVQTTITGTEEE